LFGGLPELKSVALKLEQVVEGVFPRELARVNESQEHIPDVRPVLRLKEVGILCD
jgi:hypothetical protein